MSKDLLLEIGTEEIPAHYMPSILSQIKDLAHKKLDEANISYESIRSLGTPRRVALLVGGVAKSSLMYRPKIKDRLSKLPMTVKAIRQRLLWDLPVVRKLP